MDFLYKVGVNETHWIVVRAELNDIDVPDRANAIYFYLASKYYVCAFVHMLAYSTFCTPT